MSNLSSKRAQAPEPVKDIDLKPSAEAMSQKSEINNQLAEKPAGEQVEVAPQKDVKVIEEAEKPSNEEVKTEESSQKCKEVLAEDDKESPAVETEEKPVEEATAPKVVEPEAAVEESEAKPDDKKEEKLSQNDQEKKDEAQEPEAKSKSKKRSLDDISNSLGADEKVEQSSQEPKPDGIKRLKVDIESLEKDMKELDKKDEVEVKVVDCDADKEEAPETTDEKVEEAKEDATAKDGDDATKGDADKVEEEVSATKETCEMYGIKPLCNTQSKKADTSPSVIKDIPLSKMQQDALSKSKDDAETAEANATPSLNPEVAKVAAVEKEKPTSDIEALYFNEVNKVSDQNEAQNATPAFNQPKESQ